MNAHSVDTVPRPEVVSRVRAFVTATLSFTIADADNYFELGLVSSLFGVQLIAFLERVFALKITDEDLIPDNFNTIENVSRFVARKSKIAEPFRDGHS